jgi:hypothetical protein
MKFIRFCVAALLLCLVFACNSSNNKKVAALDTVATADQQSAPPGNENEKKEQQPQQPNTTTATYTDWEKKIIKNANLNIETEDYDAYNLQVHNNVKQWGGYIAQEEQQATEYRKANTINLKVPVDQFDNIVQALTSGKDKVLIKNITSEDVTGEVVDTRARMEAKRQIRERYMDLLKQAKNMEEILQVQNVINDIQVQIESANGRINYLTHASAYSTIQLTFFQVLKPGTPDVQQPSFGNRVLDSLKNGLMWIGELLLLILNLWPLALLGIIAYWGFKKWRSARLKTGS